MPRPLLTGLCVVCLPALAQVGLPGGSALPLPMPGMTTTPFALPAWGGPAVIPFLLANPFGAAPLAAGVPWLGGLAHPGLQMAPNGLSHQHLLYLTNPYLGGPAAGNPYLPPALPLPFAPPVFSPGLPMVAQGQASPPWPAVVSPAASLPARPSNPYLPPAPGQVTSPDPASWFGQRARPPGR